jgi:polysaccharide pyruvyl transferase WcaK-like protein
VRDIPRATADASLVLAMGGGYFTDVDPEQVHRTLDLFEYAADRGIPTAMVGQGIGPLEYPELRARARSVLPRVDLIALREERKGPGLLHELGVSPDRIIVTGDDAIELAYDERRAEPGSDVGLCLRVAGYSPVAARTKDTVGRAARVFASEVGTRIRPLIISEYRSEDRKSTMPLVDGFPDVAPALGRFATPRDLAARVSRCRVLVTGAYHLGVFALSQGIPVVGLTSSEYYDDKFLGLNSMFGGGLRLVRLDEPALDERLSTAIRQSWADADALREPLRARARQQIETSRQGFERLFDLVEASRRSANRA